MYIGCLYLFGWYWCPLIKIAAWYDFVVSSVWWTFAFARKHKRTRVCTNMQNASVSGTHNTHFPTTTTPHVMATLNTLQSWAVFVCFNPHCASHHNLFATEKAFAMHLQGSPLCLAFIRCDRTLISQSCEGKCVDATFADTAVICTKRPKHAKLSILC